MLQVASLLVAVCTGDRYMDGKDELNRGNTVKYLVLWFLLGSRGRGLLDPEHEKDVKVSCRKMVDLTMRRWQQLGER
jgi:hypothetical protein